MTGTGGSSIHAGVRMQGLRACNLLNQLLCTNIVCTGLLCRSHLVLLAQHRYTQLLACTVEQHSPGNVSR